MSIKFFVSILRGAALLIVALLFFNQAAFSQSKAKTTKQLSSLQLGREWPAVLENDNSISSPFSAPLTSNKTTNSTSRIFGINSLSGIRHGDSIEFIIKNEASVPLVFNIKNNIGVSDSDLNAYLNVAKNSTSVPDSQKLITLVAGMQFLKSTRFTNWGLIFDANNRENIYNKMHVNVGFNHSIFSAQCGDFANQLEQMLYKFDAGLFPTDSFRVVDLVSVSGKGHVVLEFFWRGSWVKIDADPAEPGSIEANPQNANGLASVSDLQANPTLINTRYLYQGLDMCPWATLQDYQNYFHSSSLSNTFIPLTPIPVTNQYQLPGNSQMSFVLPINFFPIDTATEPGKTWWGNALRLSGEFVITNDSAKIDSIGILSKALYHLNNSDSSLMMQALVNGLNGTTANGPRILIFNSTLAHNAALQILLKDMIDTVPEVQFMLPQTGDVRVPLFCTSYQSGNEFGFTALDSTLGIDLNSTGSFNLWDHYMFDTVVTPNPIVADSAVNYVAYTGQGILHAAFNPTMLDFLNGFDVEVTQGTMTTYMTTINPDDSLSTSIEEKTEVNLTQLQVFPNPTDGVFNVKTDKSSSGLSIKCYDLMGREVPLQVVRTDNMLRCTINSSPGLYLIRLGQQTVKLLVK